MRGIQHFSLQYLYHAAAIRAKRGGIVALFEHPAGGQHASRRREIARIARDAITAVSVRRIWWPSETSAKPARLARQELRRRSSRLQGQWRALRNQEPPEGPANGALRIDGASRRSESIILHSAEHARKSVFWEGANSQDFGRAQAARLLGRLHENLLPARAARFEAAATSGLSVRAAARGIISVTPSSVAFSRHHSKRSNFTSDTRS